MKENSIGDMRTMSPASDGGSSLGRVDRYSLQERIGQGGFGSVWKAVDNETGVSVAIKALHPLIATNRDELERVRQNFVLVSRLTHPGICVLRHLHRIDSIDDQAQSNLRVGQGDYLVVMDLVDGVTLTQYRLARGGTLPLDEALDLGGKIADALDYAHSQRIVHRDIKPSNIMITRNLDGARAVKILDFGLAAEIRNSLSRVSRDLGDTTGTRPYMAPEQWSGKRQNAKSDQYSLAVLLYELLCGEVPFASAFESADPNVMMNVVKEESPEILDECNQVQNVSLVRALAKEKEDRWPTCVDFVHALKRCADQPPGLAEPVEESAKQRIQRLLVTPAATRPASNKERTESAVCVNCGTDCVRRAKGSWFLFFLLLAAGVIPGLIYGILMSGYRTVCPSCGSTECGDNRANGPTCPKCGEPGPFKKTPRGSLGICCLLLLLGIVPGIVYAVKYSGFRFVCKHCKGVVKDHI